MTRPRPTNHSPIVIGEETRAPLSRQDLPEMTDEEAEHVCEAYELIRKLRSLGHRSYADWIERQIDAFLETRR